MCYLLTLYRRCICKIIALFSAAVLLFVLEAVGFLLLLVFGTVPGLVGTAGLAIEPADGAGNRPMRSREYP